MKNNMIKIIAITAVAAVMGISLFACISKASNEKIEIQLEQEINNKEVTYVKIA